MPLQIETSNCWSVKDFTTFLTPGEVEKLRTTDDKELLAAFQKHELLHLDDDASFVNSRPGVGRALVCWCGKRQAVSVSARFESGKNKKYTTGRTSKKQKSTWKVKPEYKETVELCEFFYDEIFRIRPSPSGVVAFFGETNSFKSTYARGLIDLYLTKLTESKSERRPHLLTFEDPIETIFAESSQAGAKGDLAGRLQQTAQLLGVDYTPRCIGVDTPTLKEGLLNALRQKPAVVYVGETRTKQDWQDVLEFGGTGHLVVTTGHSGNLQESMSRLFRAIEAHTPAQRSFIAGKVLAVIHLRPYPKGKGHRVVPSMWRRTPSGANTLVTDGLGSILPNNPGKSYDTSVSSFGRHWFGHYINRELKKSGAKPQELIDEDLLNRLLLDDLQGL